MKKVIILLAISLTPFMALAQTWDTFRIDSVVSVGLPKGFTKTDTKMQFSLVVAVAQLVINLWNFRFKP